MVEIMTCGFDYIVPTLKNPTVLNNFSRNNKSVLLIK